MLNLLCIRCKYIRRDRQSRTPMIVSFCLNIAFVLIFLFLLMASMANLGDTDINGDYAFLAKSFKQNKYSKNITTNLNKGFNFKRNYTHLGQVPRNNLTKINSLISKYQTYENNRAPKIMLDPYKDDYYPTTYEFYIILAGVIQLILIIHYLFNTRVKEKNKKLDKFLELNGLSKIKYNISFAFIYCIFSLTPMVIVSIFCGVSWEVRVAKVFLIFLILILYAANIYAFMYFFFLLSSKIIIVLVLNIVSLFFGLILGYIEGARKLKLLFSFFPNVNIYFIIGTILHDSEKDYGEYSIYKKGYKVRGMKFKESLILSICHFALFLLLSIIINFCRCICICNKSVNVFRSKDNKNYNLIDVNEDDNYEINHQELTMNEQQKKNDNNYLKIDGISGGKIKKFNLELFSDEIFCLLGADGAGKTTLFKMILNLIPPKEGDILLDGVSLIRNKNLIYENINICPQENIFFDYLTVKENIEYIYKINSYLIDVNKITDLLNNLNLSNEENSFCKDLLAEDKRKLSLALSIIGGKKILLLDQPTYGMNIISRMQILNYLKNIQKNRIIMVSTNSSEEAEYLGTRIGIIKNGNLICSGEKDYLKKKYINDNFIYINIQINPHIFNENNQKAFFEYIKKLEPQAEFQSLMIESISIKILNNQNTSKITDYLEKLKNKNFIINYQSIYSLEQVLNKFNNNISHISEQGFNNAIRFNNEFKPNI